MSARPAPVPRELLPPLLACLPTAFFSPNPPPALLPLLSPILRQRVNVLSAGSSDNWLSLLTWDRARASKLAEKVEVMQLEAHPVSGELELQEVGKVQYRRLDQETLQARFGVPEFQLLPVYVWCQDDQQGGGGQAWRLAELRVLEDADDDTEWFDSEVQATAASQTSDDRRNVNGLAVNVQAPEPQDEDDDDYWASYDRTPARTPAAKHSPAPNSQGFPASLNRQQSTEEQDYYARYASEVQPALDSHDPDEEHPLSLIHISEPTRPY